MNNADQEDYIDTNIHLIRNKDINELLTIDKEIFPDHFHRLDQILTIRENKNKDIYVLVVDKDICGYLILNYMDETGYLQRIGVREAYQGKGFGNVLLKFAIKKFKEKNLKRTVLNVLRENKVAINLYQKYGYDIQYKSWSFKVFYEQIPDGIDMAEYSIQIVPKKRFKWISNHYFVDLERVHNLDQEKNLLLEVLYKKDSICFMRFDPTFPGCYPFDLKVVHAFWQVIKLLQQYSEEPYNDYLRVTFERNTELADFLNAANCVLVDSLYHMMKPLK